MCLTPDFTKKDSKPFAVVTLEDLTGQLEIMVWSEAYLKAQQHLVPGAVVTVTGRGVYVPGNDQVSTYTSWYQQYDYDAMNRLQRVHEYTGNSSLDWQQEYVYDRWGNRTIHQTNTFGPNIPKPNFGVNTANNLLTAPACYTPNYDAVGNVTTDTLAGAVAEQGP